MIFWNMLFQTSFHVKFKNSILTLPDWGLFMWLVSMLFKLVHVSKFHFAKFTIVCGVWWHVSMKLFSYFCSFIYSLNVHGSMHCLMMLSLDFLIRKFCISEFARIFVFNYCMNFAMMIIFLICIREVYFSIISM